MTFVPEGKLSHAKRLRGEGFSWKRIGKFLQVSPHSLQMELDPVYKARREAEQEELKNVFGDFDYEKLLPKEDGIYRNPEFDPSRDGHPVWRSPSAQILGDPPVGRSALDQRGGQN